MASDEDPTPYISPFAANLAAVIAHSKKSVNAWAKGHGLTQSTVSRIVKGQLAPTSTQIEEIARKCGLLPWQMWVPGFDPQSAPVLRSVSDRELQLYDRLKQAIVEDALHDAGNTLPGELDDSTPPGGGK